MALNYRDAGVDLDKYAEAMSRIPALIGRTNTPRVMPLSGGFAGLFRLFGDGHSYTDPVLVSGSDGVGTKLKVAQKAQRYSTVGIDLVAMCVNDCLCTGAEPLFFLDYIALPKDDPDLIGELVQGVSDGCVKAGAALLGGETAIMPDLYAEGEFDMAGFSVGVVERDQLLDGSTIKPGDVLIGLRSAGLHSNGFSLVRKIVFEHAGMTISDQPPGLEGTVADVLLKPTRIYAQEVAKLRTAELVEGEKLWPHVHGIAHITGGGLEENVSRLLPPEFVEAGGAIDIDWETWETPIVFKWLQHSGEVDTAEMRRVFNMGIGLVLVVSESAATAVLETLGEGVVIGTVTGGEPADAAEAPPEV